MTDFVIGKFNTNLTYDDATLILKYDDGEKCDDSGRQHRQTHLKFTCSHAAIDNVTKPVYLDEGE